LPLIEQGTTTSQTGLATFSSLQQQVIGYDAFGRQVQTSLTSGGVTQTLVQYTYDNANNLTCTALRMNPSAFASPPVSACVLGPLGSNGPDRITQNTYDAANQLTQVTTGYLSSSQTNYAALTYTPNGLTHTVLDAASNLTTLVYDTYDRVSQVQFPMPTKGSDASNPSDYEGYGYDNNGNLTSKRLRSGDTITFNYDALNRATSTVFPAGKSQNVYWGYDLLNRGLYARYGSASGPGVSYGYDALSRVTSETSVGKTLSYQYDAAGNRTRVTWPETGANALYVTYVYDVLNRVTQVEENGATSGPGLLASYGYDSLGRRSSLARAGGAGASTGYGYDGASRLYTLTQTLAGSASVTYTLGYNAANQVLTKQVSNSAYVAHPASLTAGYVANGLNQYTSVTGVTASYTPANSAALSYDPAGRLQTETTAGATTSLLYSGDALVGEYTSSGAIVSRYVMGPGVDEPLVWYQGAGTSTRRWLTADNQGSVIGYADGSGNSGATYTYGPYGEPIVSGGASAWGGSRYRFTGQIEILEAQLYYYKARVYDPNLGRFYQTDPAGFASDTNLYAYATEDPVNGSDPSGLLDSTGVDGPDSIDSGDDGNWGESGDLVGATFVKAIDVSPAYQNPCPIGAYCLSGDAAQSFLQQFYALNLPGDALPVTLSAFVLTVVKPQNKTNVIPKNALICTSGGASFYAPPSFNPQEIQNDGAAEGPIIGLLDAGRAVGYAGAFDFQRMHNASGGVTFFSAYTKASNFAVGLYVAGAGYNSLEASAIANGYSFLNAGHGGTSSAATYRNAGIAAAAGAGVSCKPAF
jgi:RHS repeat-associated protein